MNLVHSSPTRRAALFVLGCTLGLVLVQSSALQAADPVTLQPLSDQAAALPVTATFEKLTNGTVPPYILKIKNTSKESLAVSAKILLSVVNHSVDKSRSLPEHVIEAGQIWTITELAAQDKVVLTAKDYAPLELTVP